MNRLAGSNFPGAKRLMVEAEHRRKLVIGTLHLLCMCRQIIVIAPRSPELTHLIRVAAEGGKMLCLAWQAGRVVRAHCPGGGPGAACQ